MIILNFNDDMRGNVLFCMKEGFLFVVCIVLGKFVFVGNILEMRFIGKE